MNSKDELLHNITAEDHERITAAIRAAEANTSGEVFAVVAHESDDYAYVAGFMAALWALVLGAIVALIAYWMTFEIHVLALALAQLASFGLTWLLLRIFPALKLFLVPRHIAYWRASNNAVRQFLAHGVHTTQERSGVLIFVSLAEHYAEVVADAGINEKVDQSEWTDMVTAIVGHARNGNIADGFVESIERAGTLLALHFPPNGEQSNELDDRLIEL